MTTCTASGWYLRKSEFGKHLGKINSSESYSGMRQIYKNNVCTSITDKTKSSASASETSAAVDEAEEEEEDDEKPIV